ncbi:hypothetical protein ABBQ38_002666 [Trebouxia sp. C0009 RCD-2024]
MAAGCANATVGELQEMKNDLARHEEVLETVSAFAAQLHEHMQTRTDREGVTQAPAVAQACGEIAGLRLVAVAQQQGNTRRTLYAALSHHLKLASDDVAIAHVASVLKHLPLLGTAK